MTLPWTKFQDFYLRLGFLKVLVAVLDRARVSASNEQIYRRLRTPLFDPAVTHAPDLWERVSRTCTWYAEKHRNGDTSKPTIAEALLVEADCPSFLFAVTKPTAYKILDWGRDVGFIGRGNQITEEGLVLRTLLPAEAVDAFRAGTISAWNPFVITDTERAYLLYHLCRSDRLSLELVRALGSEARNTPLELRDAGRIVCRSFHSMLQSIEAAVRPGDLPAYRTARELALTMALEMDMPELVDEAGLSRARLRPPSRSPIGRSSRRKSTKSTDHQTVPRFEQLADLGFVRKTGPGLESGDARRRWWWIPTEACARWQQATDGAGIDESFRWNAFAAAIAHAFPRPRRAATPINDGARAIARDAWAAYEIVRRPVGHTPLDTVALYAMIGAHAEGRVLEMARVHELMLAVKRTSAAPDDAFFAGGNGMDDMFVRLRPGFVRAVEERLETIEAAWPSTDRRE